MSQLRRGRQEYEIKRHNVNTKPFERTHEGPIYRWPNVGCPLSEVNWQRARHKTTRAKVKLCEVVEVAKTFEETTFANQLMKTARNTAGAG